MENKPGNPSNNPARRPPVVRPVTRPVRPRPLDAPSSENAEPKIKPPRPPRIKSESSESNVNGGKIFLIVLVILLAASTAYLAFDKFKSQNAVANEVEDAQKSNTLLKTDIDKKVAEITRLQDSIKVVIAQKEALGQELSAERSKLAELEDLKGQIQNKQLSINSLNKKLSHFKKEYQSVQDSIEFLVSENKKLVSDKSTLEELIKAKDDSLQTLHSAKAALTQKVAQAAGLKAENFKVVALTPGGKDIKEAASYKAMVVGGLKVSFVIAENNLVEPGQKDVYFRFLEPGGSILQQDEKNFILNGKNTSYTDKQTFEFTNMGNTVSFQYLKGGKFKPGRYTLEFYTDNNKIGSTYLSLVK
jgi:hypothetical protein